MNGGILGQEAGEDEGGRVDKRAPLTGWTFMAIGRGSKKQSHREKPTGNATEVGKMGMFYF